LFCGARKKKKKSNSKTRGVKKREKPKKKWKNQPFPRVAPQLCPPGPPMERNPRINAQNKNLKKKKSKNLNPPAGKKWGRPPEPKGFPNPNFFEKTKIFWGGGVGKPAFTKRIKFCLPPSPRGKKMRAPFLKHFGGPRKTKKGFNLFPKIFFF